MTFMTKREMGRCCLRVLYYRNRIAVEYFHVLSDGGGAVTYLKTLVARYLTLRYGAKIPPTDGVLDIERTAMQCTKCGEYASNMKLNMYLPVEGKIIEKDQSVRWSIAAPAEDVEYVDPDDLPRYYRLARRYTHICEHCGGRMRYVSQKIQGKGLTCPHCRTIMDTNNFLFWD